MKRFADPIEKWLNEKGGHGMVWTWVVGLPLAVMFAGLVKRLFN